MLCDMGSELACGCVVASSGSVKEVGARSFTEPGASTASSQQQSSCESSASSLAPEMSSVGKRL